ncbi:hypothetical protein PV325_004480 [Microctonus aethiopoides]|nr:hypothetical protein PV325_004480 [Microctonus aethiopoides]
MPKRAFNGPPQKKKIRVNHKRMRYESIMPTNKIRQIYSNPNLNNSHSNSMLDARENENNVIMEQSLNDIKVQYLETPVKSNNDKKEYRVIKLSNGLTALLISDTHGDNRQENDDKRSTKDATLSTISTSENEVSEDESSTNEDSDEDEDDDDDDDGEDDDDDDDDGDDDDDDDDRKCSAKSSKKEEKMAACGLCVGVGSFSDPPEIPGLAHFLEHMVFMGSKKYPDENDFDAFIRKRGGSDNASTECEQTTFYFEIDEKYLLGALDRFAQFFISPLMYRDAISREREAVESEFQMAFPADSYRKEQLFSSFAQPNHPATKFTWGNLVTLRDNVTDDKLYEQLHKFRKRHYSAHRMTLAIQARLSLDVLEDYVKKCFSAVPNNNLPPDDFTGFVGAKSFDTLSFRRIYKLIPVRDVCQIELTWAMPSLYHLYRAKPHQYVSWIIGHEGKGSLISYLRKKMWALDICSGNDESGFEHSSMYALFNLSITLTDEGYAHLKEVLDAIFSYINMMRKLGPQQRIYDEIHMIEDTNFKFIDDDSPVDYVEDLCENMHFYPPIDYIRGSRLYFEYDPDSIMKCMNTLTPDNVNIIIFDKKFDETTFDKIEPWFKTKYTDTEIPYDWIESWKNIEPLHEFHLPEPNIFITTDFSLIPMESADYPVKIHQDNLSEIWYKPDDKFRIPECYMYFYLMSPLIRASPAGTAMLDMMVIGLKLLLVEELYPATAVELNQSIEASTEGMMIKISGFNQKLPLVLETISNYIAKCSDLITDDLFQLIQMEQLKSYYNFFLKPSKLGKDVRLSILMLTEWSAVDKYAACIHITFDQFKNFIKDFTKHLYISSLVQGNMTRDEVIKHSLKFFKTLQCGPMRPNTLPELRVVKLPLGSQCCRVQNFNDTDANSVVTNYYQSTLSSIEDTAIIETLLMIMEEPLFNQLRTQEQLGYNVFCTVRDTYGVSGYSISVCTQVDKFSVEHVDNRIEEFLKNFNETLRNMSQSELDSVKEGLIKIKKCADIHLKEEVSRHWSEIVSKYYMFDRSSREVEAIELITIEQLCNWMNQHIAGGEKWRKLSIQIVGNVTNHSDKEPMQIER